MPEPIYTPSTKAEIGLHDENISFEQVLQQKANGTRARVVIITHSMSKTQLAAVTEKLEAEEDFIVLNTLKVLGE